MHDILIALIAAIPPTLMSLATLIYAIKNSAKIDGHLSNMTDIVKTAVITKNSPREIRKTDLP